MSTVFDVSGVNVADEFSTAFSSGIDSIEITDGTSFPSVTLTVPEDVETLTVEVPGVQGPPGLQNVYIQSDDPSSGWGPEQAGYVWIQI